MDIDIVKLAVAMGQERAIVEARLEAAFPAPAAAKPGDIVGYAEETERRADGGADLVSLDIRSDGGRVEKSRKEIIPAPLQAAG